MGCVTVSVCRLCGREGLGGEHRGSRGSMHRAMQPQNQGVHETRELSVSERALGRTSLTLIMAAVLPLCAGGCLALGRAWSYPTHIALRHRFTADLWTLGSAASGATVSTSGPLLLSRRQAKGRQSSFIRHDQCTKMCLNTFILTPVACTDHA